MKIQDDSCFPALPPLPGYPRANVRMEYFRQNDSTFFDALSDRFGVSIDTILIYFTEGCASRIGIVLRQRESDFEEEFGFEEGLRYEEKSGSGNEYTHRHTRTSRVVKGG